MHRTLSPEPRYCPIIPWFCDCGARSEIHWEAGDDVEQVMNEILEAHHRANPACQRRPYVGQTAPYPD
jgi:hypothetical protein